MIERSGAGLNGRSRLLLFIKSGSIFALLRAVCLLSTIPHFWLQVPHDGGKAAVGNGSHFGFLATSKAQVDAFYAKAVEMDGQGDGAPGPR